MLRFGWYRVTLADESAVEGELFPIDLSFYLQKCCTFN